jgi:hypothetical protein
VIAARITVGAITTQIDADGPDTTAHLDLLEHCYRCVSKKSPHVYNRPRKARRGGLPRASANRKVGQASLLFRPLDAPRFCLRLVVFLRDAGGFLRGFTTAFLTVRFGRALNCLVLVRRGRLRNCLRQ